MAELHLIEDDLDGGDLITSIFEYELWLLEERLRAEVAMDAADADAGRR